MLATPGGKPFTDPAWLYEIKWDGYRCLARAGGGRPVELRTRRGADCTPCSPRRTVGTVAMEKRPAPNAWPKIGLWGMRAAAAFSSAIVEASRARRRDACRGRREWW